MSGTTKANMPEVEPVRFLLPRPPTLNQYYRTFDGRMLLSAEGRQYKRLVLSAWIKAGQPKIEGRIGCKLIFYAFNRRACDLDNRAKAVLDSFEEAGLYKDDSQIDELTILRGRVVNPGYMYAEFRQLKESVVDEVDSYISEIHAIRGGFDAIIPPV